MNKNPKEIYLFIVFFSETFTEKLQVNKLQITLWIKKSILNYKYYFSLVRCTLQKTFSHTVL